MMLDRPELTRLRQLHHQLGDDMAIHAVVVDRAGNQHKFDLVKLLLELAKNDEDLLHFMDPPKHHADVYPRASHVDDNPTGQAAIGP